MMVSCNHERTPPADVRAMATTSESQILPTSEETSSANNSSEVITTTATLSDGSTVKELPDARPIILN